jgi:predicted O-methyltransferase YrrM
VPTFTTRAELEALFDLATACPPGAQALEVGSYLGASTCYIAAGLKEKGGRLWCIDTWQNETMPGGIRDTYEEFQRNTRGMRDMITTVRKRSDAILPHEVPARLDLVFLDGDHSYEATKADFQMVEPLIAPQGTVAFHDSRWFEGVSRTIGDALAGGRWVIAGQTGNLLWLQRPNWNP